ncbi:unnamed protein product [Arabidopsis lyrata]|uniref:Predicted protein n=1 Tax=Arabidopsis lyrata subsp. lyrata TaxID=81972 RepID=D7KAV6_ARALL|nr:predicted protein [Arabidopsis lyrata subsp. lyrata]CAH8254809.1 unnamed protein product [Arabidopsis lyrata]
MSTHAYPRATDHIVPLARVPGTNHSCYGSHHAYCTCSWHKSLVLRITSCLLHLFLALFARAMDHIVPLALVPGTSHSSARQPS